MENYTTQMDAARRGIVTEQIRIVAEKEHMPVEKLMQLVAEGKVAICANKRHTCLDPEGVAACSAQRSTSISAYRETARTMTLRCRR